MDNVTTTTDLENNTLTMERTFDADKEQLWRAYADKEWFERWWGPEGWETETKEFNFVPGGRIHYRMTCVDERQSEWFGKDSWGLMVLEEVDEPNRFTAKDYFTDESGEPSKDMPSQTFIVEFVEEGDRTRLLTSAVTETSDNLEQLIKMGMVEGFSSQLNKLEALIESEGSHA